MTDENVISDRLERLRSLLRENELDALIVKREDEHLSEYIAPENERLAYISGKQNLDFRFLRKGASYKKLLRSFCGWSLCASGSGTGSGKFL